MGTGNKLNPNAFKVADISKTVYCPLARVVRRELSKIGITKGVKVLYSEEMPVKPIGDENSDIKGSGIAPASIAFVPSVAGLIIAGEVVKDLTEKV
jgi:tRNA A37 threonylcarbamoyladenosine dehydratase